MKSSFFLLCSLLAIAPSGFSQEIVDAPSREVITLAAATPAAASRIWGGTEYLLWWTKDAPQPVPLVTDGTLLGEPGSQVVLGGQDVSLHSSSGVRIAAGWWLDPELAWGIEAGGFYLGRSSSTSSAGSDATGTPFLTIPLIDAQTDQESTFLVSGPGFLAGSAILNLSSELYGLETNLVGKVLETDNTNVQFLTGIRYMNLRESLSLITVADLVAPLQGFANTTDNFLTLNEFYGGQFGASAERSLGIFSVKTTGKVALGSMRETVRIQGFQDASPGNDLGVPTFYPAGVFTAPTNIGSNTKNRFAVIPQIDVTFGFQLTRRLRGTIGYSFLFLSSVARPGDQMDRTINGSQNPSFNGRTELVGPARPAPILDSSTYWAQGLNLGLEYRW